MANRNFQQFQLSLEKAVVNLFGHVTYGAAGAPTLVAAGSQGIASVVRNSAGNYSITLQDAYVKLFSLAHLIVEADDPAAPILHVVSETITSNGKVIVVQMLAADGATATDPASGEVSKYHIMLGNSTAY